MRFLLSIAAALLTASCTNAPSPEASNAAQEREAAAKHYGASKWTELKPDPKKEGADSKASPENKDKESKAGEE